MALPARDPTQRLIPGTCRPHLETDIRYYSCSDPRTLRAQVPPTLVKWSLALRMRGRVGAPHPYPQTGLGQVNRGGQSGHTCADHERVEIATWHGLRLTALLVRSDRGLDLG